MQSAVDTGNISANLGFAAEVKLLEEIADASDKSLLSV